jgi:D-psicose/D-tagatose/L-ribulose 3-epimerase
LPALEAVKQIGYDGVEVPIVELSVADCEKWSRRLDDLGLQRTVANSRGAADNPIDPDPRIRALGVANNLRAVDCCQALGAQVMAGPYHSALFRFSGSAPTADEWRWSVEGMRPVAERAAQAGIVLAPEYVNRFECYLLTTAADMVRFVRDVGHPNCRMLYDTFHANIEERDIAQTIRACRAETVHVHISENDRGIPGSGQVDWKTTFDTLRETGYDGWMTVESFGLGGSRNMWRKVFPDELTLARDGLAFMKQQCALRGMK